MKLDTSLILRSIADRSRVLLATLAIVLIAPVAAHAQGTPLDTGFTNLQNLFTGTVAKVGSLIAIVVGGYQFAHGEPGAKRALAGVAAGTGIAVLAANVLTWLWGLNLATRFQGSPEHSSEEKHAGIEHETPKQSFQEPTQTAHVSRGRAEPLLFRVCRRSRRFQPFRESVGWRDCLHRRIRVWSLDNGGRSCNVENSCAKRTIPCSL